MTKARETDPAELWERYCEETPVARRTPQGAMAFAFDALTPAIQPQTLDSPEDHLAYVRDKLKSVGAGTQPQQMRDAYTRWAVNVLLEKIASKFEDWETLDLWRSEAASTVRSFKHDLALTRPEGNTP